MKFKSRQEESRYILISPVLKAICEHVDEYIQDNFDNELTITSAMSTKEEDEKLNRVSSQHREGRAVDFRTSDFSYSQLSELANFFNTIYINYSAVNHSGQSILMVIKSDHIHMAIRPLNKNEEEKFFREWG